MPIRKDIKNKHLAWQKQLAKKRRHSKKCIECGKRFKGHSYQKYCSEGCHREYWKKHSNYEPSWLKIRIKVFDRDNFTCQYCGRNPKEDGVKLQVEHIKPRVRGGDWELENLLTACEECNYGKGDYCLENFLKRR